MHKLLQESPDFLEAHRYLMMKVAMFIGSFVLMAYVQKIVFVRPTLPTIVQLGFFVFWVVNISYQLVSNFFVIFLLMTAVGGLLGTDFTNFMYLANAKLSKEVGDMGIMYYERELTVNLLLAANDAGILLALTLSYTLKAFYAPELLDHNPS